MQNGIFGTMSDEYKTIGAESAAELRIQGSRFIGTAVPVSTKDEAEQFIARIRKHHHDATHNCYAYRLGFDGRTFRFNDDGEPNGTAGKPILAAIDRVEVTNTLVVVTRYFGGTKLGVGGLVRAYGEAAERSIASAQVVTRFHMHRLRVSFPHSHVSTVMHVVSTCGARIVDTSYDEEVHLEIEVRRSQSDHLVTLLIEQTRGNVRLVHV